MSFILVEPDRILAARYRALAERLLTALESHYDLDAAETALICLAQNQLASSFNNQGPPDPCDQPPL